MKVQIRVHPGASRSAVGGSYAGALVVRVRERAVDGKATEAVSVALAKALGIRRRDVRLLSGLTSRNKIYEIPDATASVLIELLDQASET